MFKARRDEWPKAGAFVEAFCEEAEVAGEASGRCRRALEGLFLHTVEQGHKGGSDAPIWIRLSASDGEVSVTYEDRAPPHNPFAGPREPLGTSAQYAYLFGRNRIQFTLA